MQTSSRETPLLSIIIPARNDEFMLNFAYRLETTLNFLARNLYALGYLNQVEVVIGDWGSEVPLHKVLNISQNARQITRYVIVPPEYARPLQGDAEFPIVLVQNTAIRRSRGEYIMQTDSDILFSADFLRKLFDLLNQRLAPQLDLTHGLFGSRRAHIPHSIIKNSPSVEELELFIENNGHDLQVDIHEEFEYCATGMMFMHRDTWDECSGYDDHLTHWGWMEIDLGMRITQRYQYIDVSKYFGMMLYHLEHYSTGGEQRKSGRQTNEMKRPTRFRPNGDLWGFPTITFPIFSYSEHR